MVAPGSSGTVGIVSWGAPGANSSGAPWLRIQGAESTDPSATSGPELRETLHEHVPESQRLRRIRKREERGDQWISGLPKSAAEALNTAMRWEAEIQSGTVTRADIARRERLTRARVTQIMSLLKLDEDTKAMLQDGVGDWSIRQALREAG